MKEKGKRCRRERQRERERESKRYCQKREKVRETDRLKRDILPNSKKKREQRQTQSSLCMFYQFIDNTICSYIATVSHQQVNTKLSIPSQGTNGLYTSEQVTSIGLYYYIIKLRLCFDTMNLHIKFH